MGAQCSTQDEISGMFAMSDTSQSRSLSFNKKMKNSENRLDSMIQLEIKFMSALPAFLQGEEIRYKIKYEVFYGNTGDRWVEEANQVLYTSKKGFCFDYDITQEEQIVFAKVSFDIKKTKIQKEASLDTSFTGMQFEDIPENEFTYKIDIKFDIQETILLMGSYGAAEYLNSNIPKILPGGEVPKGLEKYENDSAIVKAAITERHGSNKKISFALTGRFDTEEDFLMVEVFEVLGKKRNMVYETLPITKAESINSRPGLFYFDKIEVNSDVFQSETLNGVDLEFSLKRVKYNKKNKETSKVLGSEVVRLKKILSLSGTKQLQMNIMKSKKVMRGTLNIGDSLIQPIFTFLDYKLHRNINIIPVIAIDYSLSNLTFDQNKQLIHTLKEGEDNDYITILKKISKVYKNLSPFMMGFGMGGKTLPKQQNASDIFSLSGNMFNPIFENADLIERYADVFKKIKVSLPINYSPVLDVVTNFARYEKENYEARNFYSLIYITPGVIDDFDQTLAAAKEIDDLPMSITVVKIYNEQLKDVNDVEKLAQQLEPELEENQRRYFNYIDFEQLKSAKQLPLFEELLIKDIPVNVKRYMAEKNIFAYDLVGDDYATRIALKYKKQQSLEDSDFQYHSLISSRRSMVGVKDYISEIRKSDEKAEEEEEKKEADSSILDSKKSRNNTTERGSSEDDVQSPRFANKRRLSYSRIMEEEYLEIAPADDEPTANKIKSLVKTGKIFDKNKDYLFYLLNLENDQGN